MFCTCRWSHGLEGNLATGGSWRGKQFKPQPWEVLPQLSQPIPPPPGSSEIKMIIGWIHGPQRMEPFEVGDHPTFSLLPALFLILWFCKIVGLNKSYQTYSIFLLVCMHVYVYTIIFTISIVGDIWCCSYSDVCVIMIICTIVIGGVVVVIMFAKRLSPPPVYCDAGGCSCLVSVAVQLFSSAEPTWY